jgi:hypothetical protein
VSNVAQGVSWYAIPHPGVRFRSDVPVTASLAACAVLLVRAAWTLGYPPLLTAYSLTNLARVLLTDPWYMVTQYPAGSYSSNTQVLIVVR